MLDQLIPRLCDSYAFTDHIRAIIRAAGLVAMATRV